MEKLNDWLGGQDSTISFAILAGVIGFIAKVAYDRWISRRSDQLDRINQQLKLLYGPLYALNVAGGRAWHAFRKKVRPAGAFFGTEPPPTETELKMWRLWMTTVFAPIHDEMTKIITQNADLFIEDDIPESIQSLLAHTAAYRVVFQRWSQNDFRRHTSVIEYPTEELDTYLDSSYRRLKNRQRELIGRIAYPIKVAKKYSEKRDRPL